MPAQLDLKSNSFGRLDTLALDFRKIDTKSIDTILKFRGLSLTTIKSYKTCYNQFKKSNLSPREFLLNITKNKRNTLALFRLLYPESCKDIKFPKRKWKPKFLPSKADLRIFYEALPDEYKPIFIRLGESGLRISELLTADIDRNNKMLIPKGHNGETKHSWISFYCTEFDKLHNVCKNQVARVFNETSKKTGIKVYPHLLRSIFAREMALKGVQPQYVDAFCGRIPQSVLARSYTDYSPETLKEIYNRAHISIL